MSENERPSRAPLLKSPTLSSPEWRELLSLGSIEITGRMPWSSNATFLVAVAYGNVEAPAVYKPGRGERPLRDFPPGLFHREIAAFELSVLGGLEVVPETILRLDAPLGEGSLQRFIDADYEEHYYSLFESGDHEEALRRIAAFDVLANNADRKGGHLLIDGDSHLWGIDNGLCFHVISKLRTVMWDFAGEVIPDEVIELCERTAGALPDSIAALLEESECAALIDRSRALVLDPRFPEPHPSRRSYPWPLV